MYTKNFSSPLEKKRGKPLLFDFEAFKKRLVDLIGNPDILEDIKTVFLWYFLTYEHFFKQPHPNLKDEQILRISLHMFDKYVLEEYGHMIVRHFRTSYRNCDYNINHFFSGHIRENRYREYLRDEVENDEELY